MSQSGACASKRLNHSPTRATNKPMLSRCQSGGTELPHERITRSHRCRRAWTVQAFTWEALEAGPGGEPAGETAKFVKRAGRARATYANGDIFEGSFDEEGRKTGHGTYTWSTAPGANPWGPQDEEETWPEGRPVRYEGGWLNGQKSGEGQIWYPNGDRYHGQWAEDKKHGDGTYFYANGDIYSGSWANDVKAGKGAYVYKRDGSQLVGEFKDGSLSTGKWVFKDGSVFVGRFKDNQPLGKGVFYFPSGNQQEGEWLHVGDEEDEEAPKQCVWRGGAVTPSATTASDVTRAPLPPAVS